MDKRIIEQMPFFRSYSGDQALIDPEAFATWLAHERESYATETMTPEEMAAADEG